MDERPQLREARNVRKSSNPDASSSVSIAPKSLNSNGTSSSGADLPYTIGDRKLFGHAQVNVNHSSVNPHPPSFVGGCGVILCCDMWCMYVVLSFM